MSHRSLANEHIFYKIHSEYPLTLQVNVTELKQITGNCHDIFTNTFGNAHSYIYLT